MTNWNPAVTCGHWRSFHSCSYHCYLLPSLFGLSRMTEVSNWSSFALSMFFQFLFIALRLDNLLTWSWVVVFVPFWVFNHAGSNRRNVRTHFRSHLVANPRSCHGSTSSLVPIRGFVFIGGSSTSSVPGFTVQQTGLQLRQ